MLDTVRVYKLPKKYLKKGVKKVFNKFKIGQFVYVRGIGKCNGKVYKHIIGKVIGKDSFFLDYEIQFKDGSTDWLDEECLEAKRKYNKKEK